MSRWGGAVAVALSQALLPANLAAQLGEAQFGAIASYGTGSAWHGGAGLIAGVGAGRLIYVGARWVYYFGSSAVQTDTGGGGTFEVRDRAQIYAFDVGLQYPIGATEVVAGVTIGAVRFSQHAEPTGGGAPQSSAPVEFLLAPNFSAQVRLSRFLLIPEFVYSFAGSPDLRWPVGSKGPLLSLRVVYAFEVQRIRR
ncbi:MAG TPA: hypothetical protein VKD28_14105 [Gemmatimonadales bacterium]|nr:hypothetical protein [Gemmatimonadales bacterium]